MLLRFQDDKLRRALREGTLVIDCVDVRLTGVMRSGQPAKTFQGGASIHVDPGNVIVGRLVWPEGMHPFVNIMRSQEVHPGQLLPDTYFFALEATDVDGNIWKNQKVEVEFEPRRTS